MRKQNTTEPRNHPRTQNLPPPNYHTRSTNNTSTDLNHPLHKQTNHPHENTITTNYAYPRAPPTQHPLNPSALKVRAQENAHTKPEEKNSPTQALAAKTTTQEIERKTQ